MSQMFIPKTIDEACEMLTIPNRVCVAGATNLYVDRGHGKYLDQDIISLHSLDELKYIKEDPDAWHIGSLTVFDTLENECMDSPLLFGLAKASSEVGGPQIRHRGTIGGNIISASPAADTVPVLMALDAALHLTSKNGDRSVSINGFMKAPGQTAIASNELLLEIEIPKQNGRTLFRKVGKRNALAISIINVAVYMECTDSNIQTIRIAIGSAGPTALRAGHVEALLTNMKKPTDQQAWTALESEMKKALKNDIHPIDDLRSTASYRQLVAGRIVCQLVKELWED